MVDIADVVQDGKQVDKSDLREWGQSVEAPTATGTTTAVPIADLFSNPLRPEQFFSGTDEDNRLAALQGAIDRLDAIGGGTLLLSGEYKLVASSGRFLDLRNTSGIEIVGMPGAQLTLDGDGVVFDCEGATRLRFHGFKVQGSHDDEDWTGTSVWKLKMCSIVHIENVETADLFGDCIRFDDGVTDVWIDGSKLDGAGRNGVTMNVDNHDTSRIWCRDTQITNFGNSGWQAEDEDVDVFMTDIHLERLRIIGPEGGTGLGVSFSKSTGSGASAQRKYKRVFMTDLVIENVFRALTIRGAEHVRARGIVAVNGVERGVEIGDGNTCSDIDIEGIFEGVGQAAVVQNGHEDEPCRDIILRGRYKGGTGINATINAEKVDIVDAEFVGGVGATVACRIGTTVKELSVINCEFTDATTRGLQIDGNADIVGEIVGNRFRGGGVTMGTGIYYNGTSNKLVIDGNTFGAGVTSAIDDTNNAARIGETNSGYSPSRSVSLEAASTEITVGGATHAVVAMSSDDGTPANRKITLTNGVFNGQRLTLILTNNAAQIESGGNVRISGGGPFDFATHTVAALVWHGSVWRIVNV